MHFVRKHKERAINKKKEKKVGGGGRGEGNLIQEEKITMDIEILILRKY